MHAHAAAGAAAVCTGCCLTSLPCSPGSRSPARSYSPLPGGTQCVRCVAGVAKCVTGSTGGCDSTNTETPTAGYQVLSVKTASTLPKASCDLAAAVSYANPKLFEQCKFTSAGTTQLSVFVDQYCQGACLLRCCRPTTSAPAAATAAAARCRCQATAAVARRARCRRSPPVPAPRAPALPQSSCRR